MASSSPIPQAVLLELRPPARGHSGAEGVLFAGLMALLLFGPLAFGAVEPWAILVQELAAALLATGCIVLWMASGSRQLRGNPLYWPWAALATIVTLQLALGIPPYMHAAVVAALTAGAGFLIFFVANEMFRNPLRVRTAARIFAGFGFVLALWSILQGFVAPGKLLGWRTTRMGGMVYGPYVNHSHYAGLMELLTPFALVMALRRNLPASTRWLYAGAAFIMAASIFLSESRGGMLALLAEFVLVFFLALTQNRTRRSYAWMALVACAFILFLMWTGADELAAHLATFRHPGVSTHLRTLIARDTLRMAAARPWLGWGLGNFQAAYPQFRSFYANEFVNAAHNDYLQYAAELGGAGALAILWFLVAFYRSGWRHLRRWSADSVSAAKLAALVGVSGLLLHSLADFNLHVPANAALFFALCALATVRSQEYG